MLDNLRDQAASSPFFQKEEEPIVEQGQVEAPHRRTFDQIIGMNAKERLMIAILLFIVLSVFGLATLLVTGKIFLPIF